jgi:SAM-dependent methyltransferase
MHPQRGPSALSESDSPRPREDREPAPAEASAASAGDAAQTGDAAPAGDSAPAEDGGLAGDAGPAVAPAAGRGLKIIGGRRSHDVLQSVLAGRTPCKLLDAPAGSGVIAQSLRELGYDVHCSDIDPGNFQALGFPFQRADLNRSLPYADASFDAVVCANGLHRLFHPRGALREFHRVLRPGGSLHVTVNNYASLDRRLRFLLLGSLDRNLSLPDYDQSIGDPEAHVRHALLWAELGNLLEATGFRVAVLRASNVKRSQRALLPLAWLLRGAALLAPGSSRRRDRVAEANGPGLLPGGKYLYAEAIRD